MDPDGSRRGSRDNGLRCANYAPVADLDPRVVDALLAALREEGIAAYAAPTPAATGGAMEVRLPSRPIDRLWVDDTQVTRAKVLVDRESSEQPAPADVDFESAWQQVLASLQATPGPATPSWPEEEPPADLDYSYDPADEAHFEPPPPPPLPRLRKATLGALAVMVFGLLIIATDVAGGSLRIVGILALIGGAASLVWNMRQGPPTDSGWDDGAVV
jgi:hypothetical protein